jgi:hypothetical protein
VSQVGSFITLLDYLLVTSLGWTKEFVNGSSGAVYRPAAGNRFYYQFDNATGYDVNIRMFRTMTAWNTGTEGTTVNSVWLNIHTNATLDSTPRTYTFASNGTFCALYCYSYSSYGIMPLFFGDFISYKTADAYASIIACGSIGSSSNGPTSHNDSRTNGSSLTSGAAYRRVMRAADQVTSDRAVALVTNPAIESLFGGAAHTLPAQASGGIMLMPIYVGDAAGVRGKLPGVCSVVTPNTMSTGDTFEGGAGDFVGKQFVVQMSGLTQKLVIETSNTWLT